MGIGIDVRTGTMVPDKRNEKTFGYLADTLSMRTKATDPNRDYAEPRIFSDCPYSERERGIGRLSRWMEDRRQDVLTESREHTYEKAFDGEGNLRTEMTIWIGRNTGKDCYTEVTKEGFYLYPSAKALDIGNRNLAVFTDDASEAVNKHVDTVIAAADRRAARDQFVDDSVRDERLERDRLKRQIKSAEKAGLDAGPLWDHLEKAQTALDDKKAAVREMPEYKNLLNPGPMENVVTAEQASAFARAVIDIPTQEAGAAL